MINTNYINITSSLFKNKINEICNKNQIESIIETGTYNGLGSTTILAQTGLPVITLECSGANVAAAIQNLMIYPNVTVVQALTLSKQEMVNFIMNDNYKHPAHVMVDSENPKSFYLQEINHSVPEDKLIEYINNDKKQLIFLDSAGGVGYLEFLKVMSLDPAIRSKKILVLDDIMHIKHYRSVEQLKAQGYYIECYDRFCVAYL